MTTESWWTIVVGPELMQGDLLPNCGVPVLPADFDPQPASGERPYVDIDIRDLIIVTQSCDLVNSKLSFVAACSVYTLAEYEESNTGFTSRGKWEAVRQGRIEGLHMLASPVAPGDNSQALVADFRQIFSLPLDYVARLADEAGERNRLRSPYLEHFSQAFARLFMRVGLPSDIRPFR